MLCVVQPQMPQNAPLNLTLHKLDDERADKRQTVKNDEGRIQRRAVTTIDLAENRA